MGQILGKPNMGDKAKKPEEAPAFPDYMLDPDAVRSKHEASSLETLVENLVKNWEVEASHKMHVSDWRTVDQEKYTFAINGGPAQDAQHMLKVGTYSAVIAANKYYSPQHSVDFEESHKAFRDMMPNFAWEVLEVYSGPPTVSFKWRHWGWMKGDYVGKNEEGVTVTIKSHGAVLDIQGVTVAKLNDRFQVTSLETWFDPMDFFNQMRPSEETMTTNHMQCPLGYKAEL
ncbi:hypothetical protein SLS53_000434 [Cytospora paraplurivora]|uniref:Pathogen-related protein n=1 Tax=Cytospora paraplurivora TaxID=2898453 RepID=A0AAN9YLP6_9PEZI